MSFLGLALRRFGCSVNRLVPSLKPQIQSPCTPSIGNSFISNFKSQSVTSCPVTQGFLKPPHASFHTSSPMSITLEYMHSRGLYKKEMKKKKSPLDGRPQMRGVILKTLIKKPKKPNSANRKCVRLRLTNGKEVTAYVPGEGHNLQEHNIVLVQGGKLQDTPGVKLVCVRGKYDLTHVKKK